MKARLFALLLLTTLNYSFDHGGETPPLEHAIDTDPQTDPEEEEATQRLEDNSQDHGGDSKSKPKHPPLVRRNGMTLQQGQKANSHLREQ